MSSTLALLVARIRADDAHHPLAPHDLALAADFLDRSLHSHVLLLSLRAERDPRLGQIVGRHFHGDLVAGKDADVMHAHLPGDVSQDHVPGLELHPEHRIGERLENLPLHLDRFFLAHQRTGKPPVPLKFAFLSRLSYWCDMRYACSCAM